MLMENNDQVINETISVRFEDVRDGTAILRLDAGVDTVVYQEFLAVAEELNLGILEAAEEAGARFSGPAQLNLDPATTSSVPGEPV
jgi:MscS family membrane protein